MTLLEAFIERVRTENNSFIIEIPKRNNDYELKQW